jgi:drug/metabolite transporter (DMT)-like permease
VGVLVGFVGIGLVVRPDPANLLTGDTGARLLILVQVASVALGGVLVQRADPDLDRVTLVGWAMLVGALVLHGASLGLGERPAASATDPVAVGAVVYLGVASTAVAFLIYFTLLAAHGAFQAGLVSYLVPIVATVVGVLVLEEPLDPLALAGFALVAVGFALLKRRAIRAALDGRTASAG